MLLKGIPHTAVFCLLLSPVVLASGSDTSDVFISVQSFATLTAQGILDLDIYYVNGRWRVSQEYTNSIKIQSNEDLWIEVTSTGFEDSNGNGSCLDNVIRYRISYDYGGSSKPVVDVAPSHSGLFHITNAFFNQHVVDGFLTLRWVMDVDETISKLNEPGYDWTRVKATSNNEHYVDKITFTIAELGETYHGQNHGTTITF